MTAYLPLTGQAERGWILPRSEVRDRGKSWACAQIGDQQFTRIEVPLDHPTERGWFVASGFHPGERLVVAGAQLLLLPFFGGSFLPDLREGNFILHMSMVPGSSLRQSLQLGQALSAELLKNPHVESTAQLAGRAELAEDT